MKKMILFLVFVFMLFGCNKYDGTDLINELDKKIENSKNYQITATLDIYRNEEKFTYDIISTYKEKEYFKVELVNQKNNHKQIILKDLESVYVVTPSLNKTFKFQSEWPYNNSQIYLMQPIIMDVKNDNQSIYEKNENGYIITSKVNYTSEKNFKKQKIYFDLEKNINKVEVVDEKDNVKMLLKIISMEYNVKLETDFFDIKRYQNESKESEASEKKSNNIEEHKTSSILEEIVYPMYIPIDTYLSSQDVVNTDLGERVILTFAGDSEFTLIQENLQTEQTTGYIYGDPYLILDTIGAITDYSVSWISNGVEYSVISDNMSVDELLCVAQSISVETVGK